MDAAEQVPSPPPVLGLAEEIGVLLADAECSQVDANRQAALHATRMLRVIQHARRHPELSVDGIEDARAIEYAERAAIMDLALRMAMSEEHVRGQVFLAERAQAHLPGLWERAVTGFASLYLVGRAVHALGPVAAPADATPEERAAERAAFAAIDTACTGWSPSCSPATFTRRHNQHRLPRTPLPEPPHPPPPHPNPLPIPPQRHHPTHHPHRTHHPRRPTTLRRHAIRPSSTTGRHLLAVEREHQLPFSHRSSSASEARNRRLLSDGCVSTRGDRR